MKPLFCRWVFSSRNHLLKRLSFPHWIALALSLKISWSYICEYISVLSTLICFIFLYLASMIFLCKETFNLLIKHCTLSWLLPFYNTLKLSSVILSWIVVLDIVEPSHFRINLSMSTKKLAGILTETVLNLEINLGENWQLWMFWSMNMVYLSIYAGLH